MTFSEALGVWDRQEALALLSFLTGYSVTDILSHGERELADGERFLSFIESRKNHMPLQYLLGRWEFYGLPFITDKRALIPRQDTEILAEAAIKHIKHTRDNKNGPLRVLDLCTGGGCLAVSVAVSTATEVTAADICPETLSLAKENAALNGADKRIRFVECDLFDGLNGETFDVIISNPPYIPSGDISALQPEVRDYEPRLALDGGEDGLVYYKRLIPESVMHLNPGGALFLEIGPWEGVMQLMAQAGFTDINTLQDYAGLKRVVYGIKPEGETHV
jgi:release factor glutamine methyltransferase